MTQRLCLLHWFFFSLSRDVDYHCGLKLKKKKERRLSNNKLVPLLLLSACVHIHSLTRRRNVTTSKTYYATPLYGSCFPPLRLGAVICVIPQDFPPDAKPSLEVTSVTATESALTQRNQSKWQKKKTSGATLRRWTSKIWYHGIIDKNAVGVGGLAWFGLGTRMRSVLSLNSASASSSPLLPSSCTHLPHTPIFLRSPLVYQLYPQVCRSFPFPPPQCFFPHTECPL